MSSRRDRRRDFSIARLRQLPFEFLVVSGDRELGKFCNDVVRWAEEDPAIGLAEHGGVVVGVSGGNDVEVQLAKRSNGASFAVVDPQPVIGDAAPGVDLERVAEQTRVAELPHERSCELIEGIREDDHLSVAAQPIEELGRTGQRAHLVDDFLDLRQGDVVLVEDSEPVAHQRVVVGLVPGRATKCFDTGPLRDIDPDLGDQDSFEVQASDHEAKLPEAARRDNRGLFAALFALFFAACAATPLRVGTSCDYPPFSVDESGGSLHGFDIAVARAYAQDRNRPVEVVPFAWPELEQRLLAGDFDVAMSGVTVRGDRLLRAPMTAAVARADALVIVRDLEDPPEPAAMAQEEDRTAGAVGSDRRPVAAPLPDLDRPGVTVLVNRGGHLEKLTRARFRRAEIVTTDDNRRLPALLASGRADAVVTDSLEAQNFGAVRWRVAEVLANDRKAYWVSPQRPDLVGDLDGWLARREADRWMATQRRVWMNDEQRSALPVLEARLVDRLGRRLMLMPLVAEVKREKGIPVLAPEREAAIVRSGSESAASVGLAPGPYAALLRAQMAASRAVQEAVLADEPSGAPDPLPDLVEDLRPAIDRLDRAIRADLVRAAPLRSSTETLVEALRVDAPVPGLDDEALRSIAAALRAIPAARRRPPASG